MKPEDDPEVRIRELERPLAETAHASELRSTEASGYPYPSGGYSHPPAPPPPPSNYTGYSTQFPGTAPRSSTGFRMFWILAAAFVVGTLALMAGIAFFATHRISHDIFVTLVPTPPSSRPSNPSRNGIPGISTASASPTEPPGTVPSTAPLPPHGGSLSVSGVHEEKTIACNDSKVSVSGVSNMVVITGHCRSLTVSGVKNSVTIDTTDAIDASGFNNQITYHSGSPKITKAGDSNVVQRG